METEQGGLSSQPMKSKDNVKMRLDFSTQNAKNNHLYPSRSIIFFIDFHYVESKKTSNQRIQKRVFGYVFTAFEGGNRGIHERCMP